MRPLFLTFEGLDGSGKSTHLLRAAEWLRERGATVCVTREPGGTELGQALREIFLDRRWGSLDGIVEAMVVFSSRRQHLLEVIDPALAAGEIVLCDRFTDSTRVYQGAARGVSLETIDQLDGLATGHREPDATFLFDLPASEARGRGASSERQAAGEVDRIDAEKLEFYEKVRGGYLELAERFVDRIRRVDSSGPIEETWDQVRRLLEAQFPEGAREGAGS